MASDPELIKVEESVKQKYLEIVKNMSYSEMQRFDKHVYQKLVRDEMIQLLPDFDKSQLNETALYVSNALNNSVKRLLPKRTREASSKAAKTSVILSESLLQDLDTTMQPLDERNEANKSDEIEICETAVTYSTGDADGSNSALDDSITLVKQTLVSENIPANNNKDNTVNSKCCDTCNIKPKSKKSHPMIRCSLCMSWFHEQCVGVGKDEPVGIWLCLTCRLIPQGLQSSITVLTTDVQQLKTSTSSIITALGRLTTQVTSSIESINDKLTALSNQVNRNDKKVSETLDSITTTSDNMKTNFEQKTCQILNKTTTIIDKIKQQTEKMNTVPAQVSDKSTSETKSTTTTISSNSNAVGQCPQKQTEPPRNQNEKPTEKAKITNKSKKTNPGPNRTSEHQTPHNEDIETVDLTKSPKPKRTIFQSTLLVGSSIMKDIQINELKKNTTVRSFPGATTDRLQNKLNQFNIDKCKNIIIHVGGNDADQGVDLETFTESYTSLLDNLESENRRLIVSGLLPRESVNLEPYNEKLKTLCQNRDIEFIDHYNGFLLASGDMADSYFHKDKVHLNSFGKKKLLKNIDAVHQVTSANTNHAVPRNGYTFVGRSGFPAKSRGYRNGPKYCHICSRNGHSTQDCWYNGRNAGLNGLNSV